MMNDLMDARAGPALPLAGTLGSLLACLDALRERFKDAVARLVGGSAARAVAGIVRLVLGTDPGEGEDDEGYAAGDGRGRRWHEDDEDRSHAPRPADSGKAPLLATFAAGLAAFLSWL